MMLKSFSSAETGRFANKFAASLLDGGALRRRRSGAFVIALSGELGAGKTTFAQGFAKGLGIRRRIISPTFVFVRRYFLQRRNKQQATRDKGQAQFFFHIDAYRIRKADDLKGLCLEEIFADSKNLVFVEWPENIKMLLPKDTTWVRMRYGGHENERVISN
ncbi:MAG: tRNA (adenosine(37)-N6)-threonylcarbamoyltransferase complex ATPase subunit type 1 TsaE [Nanoarchaeota archaeon]|nr:tRNA (adenosine(37)-N6)-threonylcarbamoyltransferase complex ATPase subunit type 1 TsaE [Nanoarchaeota archaeon]